MDNDSKYIPKGFRKTGPFYLELDGVEYVFVEHFPIKEEMTEEEKEIFKQALRNHQNGDLAFENLKVIAADPDKYDAMGHAVPAKPYISTEARLPTELLQMMRARATRETLSDPDQEILRALIEFDRGNIVLDSLRGIVWAYREYLQGGTQPATELHLKQILINEYENMRRTKNKRLELEKLVQAYVVGHISLNELMEETLSDSEMIADNSQAIQLLRAYDDGGLAIGSLQNALQKLSRLVFFPNEKPTVEVVWGREAILERLKELKAEGYETGDNPELGIATAKYVVFDYTKMKKKEGPYDDKIVSKCSKMDVRHRHYENSECLPVGPEIQEKTGRTNYNQYKGLELIDLVEQLNFNRGTAVDLIAQAGYREEDSEIQDLEKALWYVRREILRIENGGAEAGTADATKLIIQMNFLRGSAVDRIAHAGTNAESSEREDLMHGVHYIQEEIKRLKTYSED